MKQYKSWLREHFATLSEEEKLKYYPEIIAQLEESITYHRHTMLILLFFSVVYPILIVLVFALKG